MTVLSLSIKKSGRVTAACVEGIINGIIIERVSGAVRGQASRLATMKSMKLFQSARPR